MKFNINGKEIELDDSELSAALESKQESFEVDSDLVLRTTEEDATLRENLIGEGMSTGQELGRKGVMKGFGLEGEGHHKTEERTLEALNTFSTNSIAKALENAKIEPSKQLEGFQKDISLLQQTNTALQTSLDGEKDRFKTFERGINKRNTLMGLIPDNTINSKEDELILLTNGLSTDFDENGVMFGVGSDGLPIKNNTTLAVSPMSEIVTNYYNTNSHRLKAATGGAGGTDSGGGSSKQSITDFAEEMKGLGHNAGSPEYIGIMIERQKAGTLD